MDPFTIALLISAIVGAATGAYGQYQQVQAANAQADFQSDVAKENARIAEMEGNFAHDAARQAEGEHRRKVRAIRGKQRAQMGASGLLVGQGSFGDILADTTELGELDALAIRYEGDLAKWRHDVQANAATAQGQLYSASKSNPYITPAATLLTGTSSAVSQYRLAGTPISRLDTP